MGNMTVDTAVGQQAHQVEGRTVLPAVPHGLQIGFVFKKGAVLNGAADPGQILKDHPPGADVGVAHLRVAHLSLGQTDIQARGRQPAAGIGGKDFVQIWSMGVGHGIAGGVVPQAKAVHDDQGSWCFHRKTSNSKW